MRPSASIVTPNSLKYLGLQVVAVLGLHVTYLRGILSVERRGVAIRDTIQSALRDTSRVISQSGVCVCVCQNFQTHGSFRVCLPLALSPRQITSSSSSLARCPSRHFQGFGSTERPGRALPPRQSGRCSCYSCYNYEYY